MCISHCDSHDTSSQRWWNNHKQQLTEIPNNITSAVEILLLKGNCINQISATDLSTFASLTLLDLDYNGLKYLMNGCFHNNEKLSILKLSFNNIHHFPESLGPITKTLKVITLSNIITNNTTNFDLRSIHRIGWLVLRFIEVRVLGFNVLQYLPNNVRRMFVGHAPCYQSIHTHNTKHFHEPQ